MQDLQVQFYNSATPDYVGENKADPLVPGVPPTTSWTREYATANYGNPGDLWGHAWTVAEINSPSFELHVRVKATITQQQAEIDFIGLHVYVDAKGPPTFIVASSQGGKVLYDKPVVDGGGSGWDRVQIKKRTETFPQPAPVDYDPALVTEYRPRFISWLSQNRTFIWDGANRVVVYDGEYFQEGPMSAPHGPYAALWKARLFATDPNELSFSVYASGINDPDNWNAGRSHLSVADTRGGFITGLVGYDDRLVILKDSGLWSYIGDIDTGGQLREYSQFGCVAPESIARTEYGIFYVGAEGVYLTDGEGVIPIEISRPIRPLFVSRETQSIYRDAICTYYPLKRQLFVNLDPAVAETWVCQIIQGDDGPLFAWSHIPVHPFNAGGVFSYSPDLGEIMIGSTIGEVKQMDVANLDAGDPITAALRTQYARLSNNGVHGRATHLKTVARHQAQLTADIRYDEDSATEIAVGLMGRTPLTAPDNQHTRAWVPSLDAIGHHVSVELSNVGDSFEFELHEINIRTALRQPRRWLS